MLSRNQSFTREAVSSCKFLLLKNLILIVTINVLDLISAILFGAITP